MKTISIQDAKAQLSRLVELAAQGEGFIIAKYGKPMVKAIPLDASTELQATRIGFLAGQFNIPDDFDAMGSGEIGHLFNVGN